MLRERERGDHVENPHFGMKNVASFHSQYPSNVQNDPELVYMFWMKRICFVHIHLNLIVKFRFQEF